MKFNLIAAIAASAVYVSAAPLRVIVVSTNAIQGPNDSPLAHMRFGHPVPPPEDHLGRILLPAQGTPHPHRPCAGRMFRMKQKTIEIANKFRETFGLPLIESGHHGHHGKHEHGPFEGKIVPVMGAPTWITVGSSLPNGQGWDGKTRGGEPIRILPHPAPAFRPHGMEEWTEGPEDHHHNHPHRHHRSDSFIFRMQTALLSLGPWEGRAVAFVLGCGIGVLLRMLYVLAVVAYRSVRSSDEYEYVRVGAEQDEVDQVVRSAPPVYVYPVDEKIAVETCETRPAEAAQANDVSK